jgi:alpha-methylacyl-CoA racemase
LTSAEGDVGSAGPLAGIRVLDLSALGPGPFCSMVLADFGADVIHIRRPGARGPDPSLFLRRGKRELVVDLKADAGAALIARLSEQVDVLLEGGRPGAMERRGLGPDVLLARNPRLVYTRLTGWGQDGPYAARAGHDITYLATSGVLGVIGTDEPVAPLAFLGDLAGGSLLAALGTVLALFERARTGVGQVVDAAIVDGAALLLSAAFGELASGMWAGGRGTHVLSGVAPFYSVYRCADGGWFAVGAIEPPFYAAMLSILGIDDPAAQWDEAGWPALRSRMAAVFATRPRDEWTSAFASADACGAPVLEIDELASEPHLQARGTVWTDGDRFNAAPAPRLSSHPHLMPRDPSDQAPEDVLRSLGISDAEVSALIAEGIVAKFQEFP